MRERDTAGALEGGWVLRGMDAAGRPLQIVFGDTELGRAYLGLTIGRHQALCERVIAEDSVSRRHARIGVADGKLFVEDLNSLNGTILDGQEIAPFQPIPLFPGQEIRLGRVSLVLSRLDDR
jgi:hypothetical protein